ncbi:MAG: c-type cytochrome, partial [Bacteroidota bacterium]
DLSNTFLATPAFEKRLVLLLSIGIPDLLVIYVENLDAELWTLDQQVADFLEDIHHPASSQFKSFATEGLTNTETGAQYAELFRNTMNARISAIEKEIEIKQEKIAQALKLQNEEAAQLREAYQDLLWEREKHRMDAYTFDLTELGWMWLNRKRKDELATDTIAWRSLEVKIEQAAQFDELYVYSVLPTVHSIYKLSSVDQEYFYAGDREEKQMLQLIGKTAKIVAVAYKKDRLFLGETTYNTNDDANLSVRLSRSSKSKLTKWLSAEQIDFSVANRVEEDIRYSRMLHQETQRQRQLWEQQMILMELAAQAYPGCNKPDLLTAEANFLKHCTACHDASLESNLTGPALAGVTQRHQRAWFIRWVSNSQRLIAEGDPAARKIWREWGPTVMETFAGKLSLKEISDIYDFLAQQQ